MLFGKCSKERVFLYKQYIEDIEYKIKAKR